MRREHREGGDPEDPRHRDDQERMRQLQHHRQTRAAKTIVLLVLITILLLFIVWNAHQVPVSFVFLTRRIGLIWVMLACAVIGGVVGYFIGRPGRAFRFRRDDDEKD
ncbi:MAG TPA: LapA family protein [Actinomycetota bacterium]